MYEWLHMYVYIELLHTYELLHDNYKIASFTVDHLVSETTNYENLFRAKPKQINSQGNSCREKNKKKYLKKRHVSQSCR